MPAAIVVRTDRGEERLDLEEFEARVVRGEVAPQSPVLFAPVTGERWVAAGSLEIFRQLYSPRRLHFTRAFTLGRLPRVTAAFVLLNVLWFLAMRLFPSAVPDDTLLRFGAKASPLILDLGQFWRLWTANLVHESFLHIAVNLFVIFNFAGALEAAFRPWDVTLVLAASALGTTLGSFAITNPASAGASGVAYGCLGGAVVFGLRYRTILPARYRAVLGGAVIPTVLVFLFIGWTSSGVDNWGHLGGLAAGSLTVLAMKPRMLSDAPAPGRLWATRIGPLALLLAAPLAFGPASRGLLPVLVPRVDRDLGLSLSVPAEWRRGAGRLGPLTFMNGLPSYGHAQVAAGGFLAEGKPDLAAVERRYVQAELLGPEAEGRIAVVAVGPSRPARVAGLAGRSIEGTFHRGGLAFGVEAFFLARGRLAYEIELVWPQEPPGYRRIEEEIVRRVATREPAFLSRARARALFAPDSAKARAALATAETAVAP